ncbi:MAG: Eco57I restriction-modification methylase domain-containing protein [Brevinemataceae bacterium]
MHYAEKRTKGQYFTTKNIFEHVEFRNWATRANLTNETILEPFAGANSLIHMLKELNLCNSFQSFDIVPQTSEVLQKNTLASFPKKFQVVVTNPPYLAKNSASRRGIPFLEENRYDDLYKYALLKCLDNVPYVAAIIPASFLHSNLFRDRLTCYISLPYDDIFADTYHPVCLALFEDKAEQTLIYEKDTYLGILHELEKFIPEPKRDFDITFNKPTGILGLKAIDNATTNSIYFIEGKTIPSKKIKCSSRSFSRIETEIKIEIEELNFVLNKFRIQTHDIFLTPFKGIRKDGKFRRRLNFSYAKKIILSLG